MRLSRKWIWILVAVGVYLVVLAGHTPSKPEVAVLKPDPDLRPITRTAYILFREVPIWSKPNDASELIGNVHQYKTVAVTNYTKDGWTIVRFGKDQMQQGFIETRAITPAKFGHPMVVTGSSAAPLMANPRDNDVVVKWVSKGDSVDYLGKFDGKWAHVCTSNGALGFVHKTRLKTKK